MARLTSSTGEISLSTFDPVDKARVLVVGDPGVGKTSLVHLICHGTPLRSPVHTVGCSVDVKVRVSQEYSRTNRSYFIEFVDVAGSSKQRSSRSIFYANVNGIILVHDSSNRKSYQNLWKWIAEVFNTGSFKGSTSSPIGRDPPSLGRSTEFDVDVRVGEARPSIPILVVGTKADLVSDATHKRRSSIAEEYGGDCIVLSANQPLAFSATADRIDAFLTNVIETKLTTSTPLSGGHSMGSLNSLSVQGSNGGFSGGGNQLGPGLGFPSTISPEMQRRRIPQSGLFGGRPTSPNRTSISGGSQLGGYNDIWRSKSWGENIGRGRGSR
ncbi:uncharacterized protein SPPG_06634 [Spizellomyces punctatus DAOM BR117]|uniref:Small GTP-binding protein domain n=1 Tax=Spizellomyces punctatus (strain DAOM BR117) TaxID=645134 RepID=A0A0L0HBJ0_SPIPD|nr:uncharacterized protein SPPG_06634 [Spizellomyces punctatus DAOM BR117]KNC98234.1 hypothetical protein SPPG_06634 [Spizellomyces punctatus DAOM BR117]|eukprot:XP_016606274.1 hypothetical protein SPPG_06634 [Spizellomyces punctatus DAOM BR117]